jgi:signal transduction histidine kinase
MAGGSEGRVLVLAPAGRDAEVLCRLLAGDGIPAEACRDLADLASRLRDGAGALLLTEEALARQSATELTLALEGQPPWSDLPVLLLDGGRVAPPLPNVTVLPRPARALAVLTAVRSALRARRRQYEVRDAQAGLEERVRERTAELVASQGRALQAERLAAIGQTVTALAHEGRNALQRIGGCLGRLGMRLEDRPDETALVGRGQQAVADLERLFDDVRSYAAPVVLQRKSCDLAAVWREAWDRLADRRAQRDARVEEAAGTDGLPCDADPFRLGQVFLNLFANALDACTDPVVVRVTCSEAELGGRPALRVSVRDNGPGFPQEHKARLFEPFLTTKPTGTGLGMAICRRLIEAHGGTIEAGAGPGAEVVITLPRERPAYG